MDTKLRMAVIASCERMTFPNTANYNVFSTLCSLEVGDKIETTLKNNSPSEKN